MLSSISELRNNFLYFPFIPDLRSTERIPFFFWYLGWTLYSSILLGIFHFRKQTYFIHFKNKGKLYWLSSLWRVTVNTVIVDWKKFSACNYIWSNCFLMKHTIHKVQIGKKKERIFSFNIPKNQTIFILQIKLWQWLHVLFFVS